LFASGCDVYVYVSSNSLSNSDRTGLREDPLKGTLKDNLFEWLLERGIVELSPAEKVGNACGDERCRTAGPSAGGPRDTQFQEWVGDFCRKAVSQASSLAANEVLSKCKETCLKRIKEKCNPDAFGAAAPAICTIQ
jgi:hypothetical protein